VKTTGPLSDSLSEALEAEEYDLLEELLEDDSDWDVRSLSEVVWSSVSDMLDRDSESEIDA